jgi:hypothetical protein
MSVHGIKLKDRNAFRQRGGFASVLRMGLGLLGHVIDP